MLPSKLHILDDVCNIFPKNLLKDTYLICCQHVLPSLVYFMESAQILGMPKENISVIGKCYSTSELAYRMLRKNEIFVSKDSFYYNSHEEFDAQFSRNIDLFLLDRLSNINLSDDKKIIILDDGGELLMSANKYLSKYNNLLGVEQTSSGYNKLVDKAINFPIINVARSKAKLNFESPHIAISILYRLTKITDIRKKQILIIGKGVIGMELADKLKKYSTIDFYDKKFGDSLQDVVELKKYDIIIGATGEAVMSENLYSFLKKNVLLISVSSSDREFSAVNLRKKIEPNLDCHKNVSVNNIHLINSGFPINFYGSHYDNVPLKDIQLTVSLLFAGICQETSRNTGFIELDNNIHDFILKKFKEGERNEGGNGNVTHHIESNCITLNF